jgi:nucleotidyltransferase substrate binding protein (TIGR01987 family)
MNQDVRWKQRFQNFEGACRLLADALADGASSLSDLEKEGVVQRFEYTYELAWKTLKDYLESSGLVIAPVTPKQVIKEAFAAKVIESGDDWIRMLDHRNLLSHTYDASVFEAAISAIESEYLPILNELHQKLKIES